MRIVDRKTFLELPAGTVFAKGQQWYFEGTCIKGDSLPNDFTYLSLDWIESGGDVDGERNQWDRLGLMLEEGATYPMHSSYSRDGCFDDEDIFLIWERDDLLTLRGYIDAALSL